MAIWWWLKRMDLRFQKLARSTFQSASTPRASYYVTTIPTFSVVSPSQHHLLISNLDPPVTRVSITPPLPEIGRKIDGVSHHSLQVPKSKKTNDPRNLHLE